MILDPRLTPARPDLAAESLRGKVAAPRYVAGEEKRVIWPSAFLRREPSPGSACDTEALMGEAVTVYEEDAEGWSWVQLRRDGYVGYMPSAALGVPAPEPTHAVAAVRTFLYPGPNLKLPVDGFLSLGAEVAVAGIEGDYAKLARGGFVFAAHLRPLGTFEPDFVAVAERLLHAPYLWGGKTSLGLDCSGLVQLSLGTAGISAPRDTDMQEAALGAPLEVDASLSGLRRGDLVFWKGHVGIMADEAVLIHANGHHMAVVAEPLAIACERIAAKSYGAITSVRRSVSHAR